VQATDDRTAFEAALNHNPEDWDTRLVYADWLEEHPGAVECDCKGGPDAPIGYRGPMVFCPVCKATDDITAIIAAGQRWQADHWTRPNPAWVGGKGYFWLWCSGPLWSKLPKESWAVPLAIGEYKSRQEAETALAMALAKDNA
jgi:uncharacterized protein (TIGR02996 family)